MVKEMRLFRLVVLVLAAIVVLPVGIALAQQANPTRVLPATVERGGTFNVTVNFIPAGDDFHAISLTDYAPTGWNVTVAKSWCQPRPSSCRAAGNQADFAWFESYTENFTVLYKVTVSRGASLANYSFGDGFLGYYVGHSGGHIFEDITGDSEVQVIPPAICFTPSIDLYAAVGQNSRNETLQLWSSTPCMLNWTLTDDADYEGHDWLNESPTSGNCTDVPSPVVLSANTSGMPLGNYIANITIESPEANNSPQIVPVTLHISLTSILKGQVNLCRKQPQGDPTWETPLVVQFFDNSTKAEMGWSPINVTTDAYGNFTIEDICPGIYDIGIKNYTSLSKMAYGKAFTAGSITAINFDTLTEADTDNDDQVKLADFNRILNNFGARLGDPDWNPMYDFNRSGKVDLADFNLVLNNFGGKGDIYNYLG